MSENHEEDVRALAYRLWEEEGYPEGREHDHWHRAEAMILAASAVPEEKTAAAPKAKPKAAVAGEDASKAKKRAPAKAAAKPKASTGSKPVAAKV